MTIGNLDQLFRHELKEAYGAEGLMLDALSNAALASRAYKTVLDADTARSMNHIERIEQIFALIDDAPDVAVRPSLADALAKIDTFAVTIEDPSVRDAAIRSVLYTGRHHLCAQYAMLAVWARRLNLREPSAILGVILDEEKAALLPAASDNEPGSTPALPRSPTVGERLTAMFDRNRKGER